MPKNVDYLIFTAQKAPPLKTSKRKALFLDTDMELKTVDPQGVVKTLGGAGGVGPKGEKGNQGDPGPAGADGADGAQGPQGDPGETGPEGPEGPQGDVGPAGPSGTENPADAPPAVPNAKDDEFTSSATLPGGGSAKWAWRNQGTGAVAIGADSDSAILYAPGLAGINLRCLFQTVPATPYTVTAKFTSLSVASNGNKMGLAFGDGTRVQFWGMSTDSIWLLRGLQFSNPTSFSGVNIGSTSIQHTTAYFRIADNGTNFVYSISFDGSSWIEVATQSRTALFPAGPTEIGFLCNSESIWPTYLQCHWFRVTQP